MNFVLMMAWQWLTIQHLQTSEQDVENTATEKEWHCIVQSMTDQHGVLLECMIQEKMHCPMKTEEINPKV